MKDYIKEVLYVQNKVNECERGLDCYLFVPSLFELVFFSVFCSAPVTEEKDLSLLSVRPLVELSTMAALVLNFSSADDHRTRPHETLSG